MTSLTSAVENVLRGRFGTGVVYTPPAPTLGDPFSRVPSIRTEDGFIFQEPLDLAETAYDWIQRAEKAYFAYQSDTWRILQEANP